MLSGRGVVANEHGAMVDDDCQGKAEETGKDTSAISFRRKVSESTGTENDVL